MPVLCDGRNNLTDPKPSLAREMSRFTSETINCKNWPLTVLSSASREFSWSNLNKHQKIRSLHLRYGQMYSCIVRTYAHMPISLLPRILISENNFRLQRREQHPPRCSQEHVNLEPLYLNSLLSLIEGIATWQTETIFIFSANIPTTPPYF